MAERAHLSIGEVLSLVQEDFPDVTISKIRFLESQGLLDPERTPSGYRKFYDDDIERLEWILTQQRDNFLPLKVIRERLDEWDATGTAPGRRPPDTAAVRPPESATTDAADDRAAPTSRRPTSRPPSRDAAADARPRRRPTRRRRHRPVEPDAGRRHGRRARPHPKRRSRAGDVAMETARRVEAPAQAATAATDELRVGPTSTSLTAEELAERAGVPVAVIAELESFSMIESTADRRRVVLRADRHRSSPRRAAASSTTASRSGTCACTRSPPNARPGSSSSWSCRCSSSATPKPGPERSTW